jgi:hypothetical protein
LTGSTVESIILMMLVIEIIPSEIIQISTRILRVPVEEIENLAKV